jgi:hypothetical protein
MLFLQLPISGNLIVPMSRSSRVKLSSMLLRYALQQVSNIRSFVNEAHRKLVFNILFGAHC